MAPQAYAPQSWGAPSYQQQQWGMPGQNNDQVGQPAPGGGGGGVQMNPSTGQPDYSLQWAEYYRSLGMHREAEAIVEQQVSTMSTILT